MLINVQTNGYRPARTRGGIDTAGCASACDGGVARGDINDVVAMLTLVRGSLTIEVLKDRFSTRDGLAFTNGTRMAVRARSELTPVALPSTLEPLWQPYVSGLTEKKPCHEDVQCGDGRQCAFC